MFDSHHHHRTEHYGPSNVTVEHKRAPTDESIRLYAEMLDKARAEVIATIAGEHLNVLSNAHVVIQHDLMHCARKHYLTFSLNGRPHKLLFDVNDYQSSRDALVKAVVDELARVLHRTLFQSQK